MIWLYCWHLKQRYSSNERQVTFNLSFSLSLLIFYATLLPCFLLICICIFKYRHSLTVDAICFFLLFRPSVHSMEEEPAGCCLLWSNRHLQGTGRHLVRWYVGLGYLHQPQESVAVVPLWFAVLKLPQVDWEPFAGCFQSLRSSRHRLDAHSSQRSTSS